MARIIILLFGLLAVGAGLPAFGQPPARQDTPPPGLTADQARIALDVLNDPAKRAAFAATLNALVKAQPNPGVALAGPAASPGTKPGDAAKPVAETPLDALKIPLAPDSLGAQVLVSASGFVNNLGNQTVAALDTVQSLPLLYGWAVVMATNPVARDLLADVAWRVALVLACAIAVEYGLRRLMRRPIAAVEAMAPGKTPEETPESVEAEADSDADTPIAEARPVATYDALAELEAEERGPMKPAARRKARPSALVFLRRVPLVLARLLLELVPVLGIFLIGHLFVASSLGGQTVSRLIILAVIDAYAMCAALLAVARMLLSPKASRLRLFHLRDSTAAYMTAWTRRIVLIAVCGYAVGEVGLLLGLSDLAHELLQKAIGLVLQMCLAVIVVQKRKAVRRRLRAPEGATGLTALLRNRIAAIWHWIALFFLVVSWLVWAVELPHGYVAVLHYAVVTGLVLIGARLAILLLLGGVDKFMRPGPENPMLSPAIDARLRVYHPAVCWSLRLLIYVLCVLGLLQLYGLNTFLWLVDSSLGLRVLSAIGTLTTTIVLAFGVWEVVNIGVQRHLDRLQREAQMAKSARLRTLLPLLRTGLLITIAIVSGLMVLSEIGINIAPLLAGAGIVGVAIGFGSQKLVQDLITGIFLLLENAMQVGDTVTAAGLTGVVEALSVRTIRLRAADGSVHIIPFSSVASVTNLNRGLGNAAVTVIVPYDEDTDRVCDELKAIVSGMRDDPAFAGRMLGDLQLWGVDKVDGASVTIAGQVPCTDTGRWVVQREFNRRMKRNFQELGIRIFNPMQTVGFSGSFPVEAPAHGGEQHGHAQAAD